MDEYQVTLTHADLEGPFVVDLFATSDAAAIRRVQLTAMHTYRHPPLLTAPCTARLTGVTTGDAS